METWEVLALFNSTGREGGWEIEPEFIRQQGSEYFVNLRGGREKKELMQAQRGSPRTEKEKGPWCSALVRLII